MQGCGFGCSLHQLAYCLMMAYAVERTLVIEPKDWRYQWDIKYKENTGWESVFLPLSKTCTHPNGQISNIQLWHNDGGTKIYFRITDLLLI
jgi:glycoprotein 6-alpha-L-fucosyltransferase